MHTDCGGRFGGLRVPEFGCVDLWGMPVVGGAESIALVEGWFGVWGGGCLGCLLLQALAK